MMSARSFYLILLVTSIHFRMNGQYIYHDAIPDVYIQDLYYSIDLNQDGIDDFVIGNAYAGPPQYIWLDGVSPLDTNKVLCDSVGPLVLNTGDTIQASSQTWGTNYNLLHVSSMQHVNGHWYMVGVKYVGLRFVINNSWHYGWVRIEASTYITLYDWGYNATPDSSIIAGNGIDVGITSNQLQSSSIYAYGKQVKIRTELPNTPSVFKLYNSTGQLVNQQELENVETSINCERLPAGIYFAEVYCNGKAFSQKLLLNDL